MFQWTWWILPSLVACLTVIAMLMQWRRYYHVPGIVGILWVLIGVAIWSLAHVFEVILVAKEHKMTAATLMYLGIGITPVAWFGFAVTYVRRWQPLSLSTTTILSIIPAVSFLLVLTNDLHHVGFRGKA
ncbi:MAG: histidine kinase N-terminal 7TM domain-containing protein, partial [Pseudomonadota bacterium]